MDELEENKLRFRSFQHYEEFQKIIAEAQSGELTCTKQELLDQKMVELFNYYLEQPQLLDSKLKEMLLGVLDISIKKNIDKKLKHFLFRVLFNIIKTRGYKHVIRLMPHSAVDLEPTLAMLCNEDPSNQMVWQTCYALLLWLCIVVSVPFGLDTMGDPNKKPISVRIYETTLKFLVLRFKSQEPAAYLLSKLISRPDMVEEYLPKAINLSLERINTTSLHIEHYEISGHLMFFCNLCKFCPRDQLRRFLPQLLDMCKGQKEIAIKNVVNDHLLCKLMQRLAVLYCPATQHCKWMYKRRSNVLALNLNAETQGKENLAVTLNDDSDVEIPDQVAEIIDYLLTDLRSKFTKIRWSAAKGLAKISFHLPAAMVEEVLSAILELCTDFEPHFSWHGACLSLGEMGRRGLLLTDRLGAVFSVMKRALFYNEKAGECAYGSNVRDAACYVCWAFARSFDPEHLAPFVEDFATVLLLVSLFDRDVGVRRAASAAFQENVGRQNQFPNGIDIITHCDYFSVGNLSKCYLQLSVFVAQFPIYVKPMLEFLTDSLCLGHWDPEIRSLSGKALSKVALFDKNFTTKTVLPKLLAKMDTCAEFPMRAGSIIGLAELISCIPELKSDEKLLQKMELIIPRFKEKRYFDGINGDLLRQAVDQLIKNASLVGFVSQEHEQLLLSWREFLEFGVDATDQTLQSSSVDAYSALLNQYASIRPPVLQDMLKRLHQSKETARSGALMILASCCSVLCDFNSPACIDQLLSEICACCDCLQPNPTESALWIDARQQAFASLRGFALALLDHEPSKQRFDLVLNTFIQGFEDYTTDSKGDSGSLVRESVMNNAVSMILEVTNRGMAELLDTELVEKIGINCARQGVEKIDRIRGCGVENFYKLVTHEPKVHLPNLAATSAIFASDSTPHWIVANETFPLFVNLLDFEQLRPQIVLGLAISIGSQLKNTMEASRNSLREFFLHRDPALIRTVFELLLTHLKEQSTSQRTVMPLLLTMDYFLTDTLFTSAID
ncbi:hypothetical protein Ciccas_004323, partial [Cichlidogyrus casuarinus]